MHIHLQGNILMASTWVGLAKHHDVSLHTFIPTSDLELAMKLVRHQRQVSQLCGSGIGKLHSAALGRIDQLDNQATLPLQLADQSRCFQIPWKEAIVVLLEH